MFILGIDLAWGDRNPDGLCWINATEHEAGIVETQLSWGDQNLLAFVRALTGRKAALLAIDAPIVIENANGTRPVDRLTHRLFHRQHAACHPANLEKCARPARIGKALVGLGYHLGWNLKYRRRVAAEVYPHPAMCRLFGLDRILKYKKGKVQHRRAEFRRLQRLIRKLLKEQYPELQTSNQIRQLLRQPWTKPIEDQTDALFCAVIGYHHWKYAGQRSEIIGDLQTGFILLPKE